MLVRNHIASVSDISSMVYRNDDEVELRERIYIILVIFITINPTLRKLDDPRYSVFGQRKEVDVNVLRAHLPPSYTGFRIPSVQTNVLAFKVNS